MKKKVILGATIVLFLLISPFVTQSSAFANYFTKNQSTSSECDILIPFWFLCYVNSSGYGKAVHSGNGMFMAIEYSEEDTNVSTNLRSFLHISTLNETHKLQIFFFIGESDLPFSGTEGDCHISGMALMAYVW